MGGAMDVQRGHVFAGSQGGHDGGDEHPGSLPGVQFAPGHGEQYADLFGAAWVPVAECARRPPTLRQAQEEPYTGVIDRILEDDHHVPQKQRHSAKRIMSGSGRVRVA